jgi:hypothetical protein
MFGKPPESAAAAAALRELGATEGTIVAPPPRAAGLVPGARPATASTERLRAPESR